MESLLPYLIPIAVFACPVGMILMMWFMGRSRGQNMCGMDMTPPTQANVPSANKDAQIAALQEQVLTMQAQVRALEASAQITVK